MPNITLFAQIIQHLPKVLIRKIIREHKTDKHSKRFDTWSHLISMVFSQFANCTSLRDISNGLCSATGNLNHMGIRHSPSKSTIGYQNEHRDSSVFRDIYFALLSYLGQQAGFKQTKFKFKNKVQLLDSTLISLCIEVYDWAEYTRHKGAVKLHTLLDFDGLMPSFIAITDGKGADNTVAKNIPIEANTIIVADRIYSNYGLLNYWDSKGAFFVVRHKDNIRFTSIRELDLPEKRHQNVLKDEIIELELPSSKQMYPKKLRRIVVYNQEKGFTVELLTNNFKLAASTIAELYKSRWQIEIFFRQIKQLLHIKSFIGTSRNAVEIQIWTAMITILIMTYLKHIAKYKWQLSNLVSSLRLNTFTKIDLMKWINEPFTPPPEPQNPYQGGLFPEFYS